MTVKQFTLSEGVNPGPLNFGAGSLCRAALVDNLSASWLYVTEAQRYIAPGTLGQVVPLPTPSAYVTLAWQPPPGYVVPPVGTPPGSASVTLLDSVPAASPSASVSPPGGHDVLGHLTIPANSGPTDYTLTLPVPTGTHAIMVCGFDDGITLTCSELSAWDSVQNNVVYAGFVPRGVVYFPVTWLLSGSVTVTVKGAQNSSGQARTVTFIRVTDPEVVSVNSNDTVGVAFPIEPVIIAQPVPAYCKLISTSLPGNGNVVVLGAAVRVKHLQLISTANTGIQIIDGLTEIGLIYPGAPTQPPAPVPLDDYLTTTSLTLNATGAPTTLYGYVTYAPTQ